MKVTPTFDQNAGVELRADDRLAHTPSRSGTGKSAPVVSRYFSYTLLAAIMAHALLVVGVTTYMSRSISGLRDVSAKLDSLSQFESRISEKISAQNVAVQTLINETNARLSTIRSDGEAAIVVSRETSQRLDELLVRMESLAGAIESIPARTDLTEANSAEASRNSARQGSSLPPPPAGYRRIRGSDGSVTYEKIR